MFQKWDFEQITLEFLIEAMWKLKEKDSDPLRKVNLSNAGFMRVCRLLLFLSLSVIFHFDASFCIKICIKNHSCDAL